MDVVKKIEAQNSTPPKKACVIEVPEMVRGKGVESQYVLKHDLRPCNSCIMLYQHHQQYQISVLSIISIISTIMVIRTDKCPKYCWRFMSLHLPKMKATSFSILFLFIFSPGLRWTASGVSRFLRLAEEQNSPVGWLMGLEPPNRSCEDKSQGMPICCYCTIYNEYNKEIVRSLYWWISINVQALKFRLWIIPYSLFVTEWVAFSLRRYADVAHLMTRTEVDRCTMMCLL